MSIVFLENASEKCAVLASEIKFVHRLDECRTGSIFIEPRVVICYGNNLVFIVPCGNINNRDIVFNRIVVEWQEGIKQ